MDLDITLLKLYNADVKLGITLKRTRSKQYKYIKQITANRNMHTTQIYDDLELIKSEIFCDIVNGYEITHNLLGLDLIDSILEGIPASRPSSPTPALCVSNLTASPQQEEEE